MLTVFTAPKGFVGHIGTIQRNAIQSWMRLDADVEIILFGTDEGTAEVARELGVRHEPEVERNEFGSMLVSGMFARAQRMARHETLCYVNCDIVLMEDFAGAVGRVRKAHREFLMVGRRWDMEITRALEFERAGWQSDLRERARRDGKQRGAEWIDYFAFSRGLYGADTPEFAIGRTCWDNWLVWKALEEKKPVVDATAMVMAVHQNHDYSHHPQGERGAWHGDEAQRNLELAGGRRHLRTMADANLTAARSGLRWNVGRYWVWTKRSVIDVAAKFLRYRVWNPVWFAALGVSRPLRNAMGWRGGNVKGSRQDL
jgi:hypothetical protein